MKKNYFTREISEYQIIQISSKFKHLTFIKIIMDNFLIAVYLAINEDLLLHFQAFWPINS